MGTALQALPVQRDGAAIFARQGGLLNSGRPPLLLLHGHPQTMAMHEGTTAALARAGWHWFLLSQPAPLPERLIEADPLAYLRDGMGRRRPPRHPAAAPAVERQRRCGCCFEPLTPWRAAAEHVSGRAVDSGHSIAEETPDEVLAEAAEFFDKDE